MCGSIYFRCGALAALCFVTVASVVASPAPQGGGSRTGRARIDGRVLAPGGRGIQNIRVTLLNDGYSTLKTVYTDASGRFQFGVPGGAYYIEAEPIDQPYQRHRERVDLNPGPFSKLGEVFYVNIQLVPLAKKDGAPPAGAGVRFVQEVPEKARSEFERGKQLLAGNPEAAYAAMRKSLQIFPDYYDALETLGGEYVRAGYYDHALPILLHGIDVNPNGEQSYYALGVLFYQTKHFGNACKAFRRVLRTNPASANASIYLGLALFREGKAADAEAALKKAVELGATNVPDLHLALADIYIETKRYREAVAELELLLKQNPNLKDKAKVQGLIQSLRAKADRAS